MNKIYYPAVFHSEESGYSVRVPDLDGCFTQGETLDEAVEMVQEAIGLMLEDAADIPAPSNPAAVSVQAGEFIVVIPFDRAAYLRRHDTRAVKKTLTIPSWLNAAAEEQHINFSSVLQTALKGHLHISD